MTLSFGKFIADGATNVIPDEVTLAGSLRCMNEAERRKMLLLIPQIARSTAEAYGCTCDVDLPDGYPCTVSDEEITERVREMAADFLGEACVSEYPARMTAEDFGFYTQLYPCCFYRFGVSPEGKTTGKLHSSTFLIDEEALKTAAGLFAYIGIEANGNYGFRQPTGTTYTPSCR